MYKVIITLRVVDVASRIVIRVLPLSLSENVRRSAHFLTFATFSLRIGACFSLRGLMEKAPHLEESNCFVTTYVGEKSALLIKRPSGEAVRLLDKRIAIAKFEASSDAFRLKDCTLRSIDGFEKCISGESARFWKHACS